VEEATRAPLPTRAVAPRNSISADGALALATPALQLSFDVTARVTKVNIVAGQTVKTGDVLAEVDASSLHDTLQQAKDQLALTEAQTAQQQAPARDSDLASARASLNAAVARYNELKKGSTAMQVEQALRGWNQVKNSLYQAQLKRDTECGWSAGKPEADKITPANDPDCKYEQYQVTISELSERTAYMRYVDAQKPPTAERLAAAWADVVSARASLTKLEAGVSAEAKRVADVQLTQAKLAVVRAERNLAKAQLVAPCNCTVQSVDVVPGAASSPGTTAVTLLKLEDIRFRTTNLSERDVIDIAPGNTVSLRLRAFDDDFTGQVRAVLPLSSGTQGSNALFTVIVALDPTERALLPGMSGQAEIQLGTR
jgi:multidrug resistance efflux pump